MRKQNIFTTLEFKTPDQESERFLRKESLRLTGLILCSDSSFAVTQPRRTDAHSVTKTLQHRQLRRAGFTLIELLTVIAIMVFLLAILLPSLHRAGRQAKAVACQSNLHQWGLLSATSSIDIDKLFFEVQDLTQSKTGTLFVDGPNWEPHYGDHNDLLLCPIAAKPLMSSADLYQYLENNPSIEKSSLISCIGKKFSAWSLIGPLRRALVGSYGSTDSLWRFEYMSTTSKALSNAPLFFDSSYQWSLIEVAQIPPPEFDDIHLSLFSVDDVCINRHDGYVNYVFKDLSARKVGLKELWTLKWDPEFDTTGPWTKAGGVRQEDWPKWMRKFKDY